MNEYSRPMFMRCVFVCAVMVMVVVAVVAVKGSD